MGRYIKVFIAAIFIIVLLSCYEVFLDYMDILNYNQLAAGQADALSQPCGDALSQHYGDALSQHCGDSSTHRSGDGGTRDGGLPESRDADVIPQVDGKIYNYIAGYIARLSMRDRITLLSAIRKLSSEDINRLVDLYNSGFTEKNLDSAREILEKALGRETTEKLFSMVEE